MPCRVKRADIGKIFLARFIDHSENVGHALETEAVGRLIGFDRVSVTIRGWNILERDDVEGNVEWTLCRKLVSTFTELRKDSHGETQAQDDKPCRRQ